MNLNNIILASYIVSTDVGEWLKYVEKLSHIKSVIYETNLIKGGKIDEFLRWLSKQQNNHLYS